MFLLLYSHTVPLTGALISSSSPASSSMPSQPPARPCRPRLPPPMLKPSHLPSRPPLPQTTPASLPPAPAPPFSLCSNTSAPSLPAPLSPIVISQSTLESSFSSDPTPSFSAAALPSSLPPTVSSPPASPPVIPPSSPAALHLSTIDQLVGSLSVWQPRGLSQDNISCLLEKQSAGTFLAHGAEDKVTMISVRLPDELGSPVICSVAVKQHQT
ncbi:hypothetical protein XENORESO_019745, partial [Xenotaenia resolanae]